MGLHQQCTKLLYTVPEGQLWHNFRTQLMKAYMAETSYNQLSLTDSTTYVRTHMLIKINLLAQQSSKEPLKCQLYYVQF